MRHRTSISLPSHPLSTTALSGFRIDLNEDSQSPHSQPRPVRSVGLCAVDHARCGIDLQGDLQGYVGRYIGDCPGYGESPHVARPRLSVFEGIDELHLPFARVRARSCSVKAGQTVQRTSGLLIPTPQEVFLPDPSRRTYAEVTARSPPSSPLQQSYAPYPDHLRSPVSDRLVPLNRPSAEVRDEVPLGMWAARATSLSPTKSTSTAGETWLDTPSASLVDLQGLVIGYGSLADLIAPSDHRGKSGLDLELGPSLSDLADSPCDEEAHSPPPIQLISQRSSAMSTTGEISGKARQVSAVSASSQSSTRTVRRGGASPSSQ